MPRAETRGRDAAALAGLPSGGQTLHAILDGLITRVEASPLMGRAPTSCTPDEQARLVTMLSGLSELRATMSALSAVPDVRLALVDEVWPELAAVLKPSAAGKSPTPRSTSGEGSPRPSSSGRSARATQQSRGEEAPAVTPSTEPEEPTPVVDSTASDRARARKAVVERVQPGSQDLRAAVRSVLRADTRPLTGARIASLVQETAPEATREQVYETLYRSTDLFRKTSHGWELVVSP